MVLSSWFYDELIKFWCVFNILQLLFKTFSFRHEEIDDLMSFWWISLEVPTRLQTCMPKPSLLLGSGWSILNLFISAICHLGDLDLWFFSCTCVQKSLGFHTGNMSHERQGIWGFMAGAWGGYCNVYIVAVCLK